MSLKNVLLSLLFTFGAITQIWADPIKSINIAANQEMTMKMNKNEIAIEEKTRPAKDLNASLKKHKAKFQSGTSYDDGAIMSSKKYGVNFLKIVKERKKPLLTEPLDKVIYSYKFSQNAEREKFSNFQEVTKTNYSNSDFGQFILKPHQNGNKYLEEGRTSATLKLLQSKKEEIFKEIFLGFRFSFNPMRGHNFLEMNVTPSFEKGPGIIIPF